MKIAKLILLAALVAVTSGCQIATKKVGQLNTLLVELDRLGIEESPHPRRVTSTKYVRDGDRSTLTHNNPQLSEPIKIVRRRPVEN